MRGLTGRQTPAAVKPPYSTAFFEDTQKQGAELVEQQPVHAPFADVPAPDLLRIVPFHLFEDQRGRQDRAVPEQFVSPFGFKEFRHPQSGAAFRIPLLCSTHAGLGSIPVAQMCRTPTPRKISAPWPLPWRCAGRRRGSRRTHRDGSRESLVSCKQLRPVPKDLVGGRQCRPRP